MFSDFLATAQKAERDLNPQAAKQSHSNSNSTAGESSVDTSVESKFPGSKVTHSSAASGAGGSREIPVEEGGGAKRGGGTTKARDFEGLAPEDEAERNRRDKGGGGDVAGITTSAGARGV